MSNQYPLITFFLRNSQFYAVKSSLFLRFLESVPDEAAKLKEPKSLQAATPAFEEVVKPAQEAAALVLVY